MRAHECLEYSSRHLHLTCLSIDPLPCLVLGINEMKDLFLLSFYVLNINHAFFLCRFFLLCITVIKFSLFMYPSATSLYPYLHGFGSYTFYLHFPSLFLNFYYACSDLLLNVYHSLSSFQLWFLTFPVHLNVKSP